LEAVEESRERVGLGRRQVGKQSGEPHPQRGLRRAQRPRAAIGEGQRLAAAVVAEPVAGEHAGIFQRGEEL
jgi:hypothetical protein